MFQRGCGCGNPLKCSSLILSNFSWVKHAIDTPTYNGHVEQIYSTTACEYESYCEREMFGNIISAVTRAAGTPPPCAVETLNYVAHIVWRVPGTELGEDCLHISRGLLSTMCVVHKDRCTPPMCFRLYDHLLSPLLLPSRGVFCLLSPHIFSAPYFRFSVPFSEAAFLFSVSVFWILMVSDVCFCLVSIFCALPILSWFLPPPHPSPPLFPAFSCTS